MLAFETNHETTVEEYFDFHCTKFANIGSIFPKYFHNTCTILLNNDRIFSYIWVKVSQRLLKIGQYYTLLIEISIGNGSTRWHKIMQDWKSCKEIYSFRSCSATRSCFLCFSEIFGIDGENFSYSLQIFFENFPFRSEEVPNPQIIEKKKVFFEEFFS